MVWPRQAPPIPDSQTSLLDPTDTEADLKFKAFHAANPRVYQELLKLTKEARAAGRTKVGIKMLWEVVRWNIWLQTSDAHFKLPNNHHSRYARLIMDENPEFKDFFETRRLKT